VRGLRFSSLEGLARRFFRSALLRKFVSRFATYAGASPARVSAAFAGVAHLERTEGVHHVEGGMGALAAALTQAVERQGVRIRLSERARWRSQGDSFLAGLPGDEQRFDALVLNADPLGALGRPRSALALSGYVLLVSVQGRADLPHHSVLFTQDYGAEFDTLFRGALPERPTLHVCHPSATEPALASPERDGLYVMVNAPVLASGRPFADGPRLRRYCLERLETQWPALKRRLSVLMERTPKDFERLGAPGGSLYGHLPHGKLGALRRPRIRGPVPGLFFAGGGTHPGGGVPLATRSGVFAARLVLEHLDGRRRRGA
jgi:phytoene dehydrogenase-like protein